MINLEHFIKLNMIKMVERWTTQKILFLVWNYLDILVTTSDSHGGS
jgi:hypothetical protein